MVACCSVVCCAMVWWRVVVWCGVGGVRSVGVENGLLDRIRITFEIVWWLDERKIVEWCGSSSCVYHGVGRDRVGL